MVGAMASFAFGDAIVKAVSVVLPLSQILVIRGAFASIILFAAVILFKQTAAFRFLLNGPLILRLLGEIIATAFFLTALFNMPLANASAIMQALPLTVSLGAAYFFGEAIGWRRILAISVGFSGVLLIIKPGLEGFNAYALLCLVAIFGTTMRDLATRKLDERLPSLFVSFVTVVVITCFGGVMSFFQEWAPVDAKQIGLLALASLFLISGFFTIISAMRFGEVGIVTPFRYSVLIFSVILGFLIFNEVPDYLTILGSVIVVASGVYTLYRERIRHRRTLGPIR